MNGERNFLLGYGERLTEPIPRPPITPNKAHPYSTEEAVERLLPRLQNVTRELDALPPEACPQDRTVAVVTLHPAYVAKSYFPGRLLQDLNLHPVGSRPSLVCPDKWTRVGEPQDSASVELFVSGSRDSFHNWINDLTHHRLSRRSAEEICRIEDLRCFAPGERLRGLPKILGKRDILMEIALHSGEDDDYVLAGFEKFLSSLDLHADFDRRLYAKGLCFLPARLPAHKVRQIEQFSFLRVARPMPDLREFDPFLRASEGPKQITVSLPDSDAVDPTIRAAVFDGGIPAVPNITKWAAAKKPAGIGTAHPTTKKHGLAVTSALLFGAVNAGQPLPTPYCKVDSYRVLDTQDGTDADLFDVLRRVMDILNRRQHSFVNFSIGPALPAEDDDVNVWTSVLDEYLSNGDVLATVAVGNEGTNDWASGNARIQVPSDCVNALSVGACDSLLHDRWRRAAYSCIGPGRSPGIVKPDVVGFGGTADDPFYVLAAGRPHMAVPVQGTSFAAPLVLRLAAGIRAHFGSGISALALKALLVNRCDHGSQDRREVGWGRVSSSVEDVVVCSDRSVTVLFQGMLEPGKYLRAPIPVPSDELQGMVSITSTFCFACETDPQDPSNYTRSGLDITFRPHFERRKDSSQQNADSANFFSQTQLYKTEQELRSDAHKWETVLHASQRKRASSLSEPVFDVHYHARQEGQSTTGARKIPYALVVTVEAPKVPDLYNRVVTRYRTVLEVLQPTIQIPIQTTVR